MALGSGPSRGRSSVEAGDPRPILGIDIREDVHPWTLEDTSILVTTSGEVPARVDRIELETGQRSRWREISPPDPTGAFALRGFTFARDADAYGFTYVVQLDDLYLLEGLR